MRSDVPLWIRKCLKRPGGLPLYASRDKNAGRCTFCAEVVFRRSEIAALFKAHVRTPLTCGDIVPHQTCLGIICPLRLLLLFADRNDSMLPTMRPQQYQT